MEDVTSHQHRLVELWVEERPMQLRPNGLAQAERDGGIEGGGGTAAA